MSIELVLLITIVPLLILLGVGQPIGFAMCCVGLLGIFLILGGDMVSLIELSMWRKTNSFVLTAIPLFLFMGEVTLGIGMSERLYKGMTPLVSKLPGGLLHTNIVACSIFAAISGSSVATIAFIGTIAVPEMENRKYDSGLIAGSLAGGGTLGILIPPSIIMIVYGSLTNQSVGRLFMAGVIPGIITALMYVIYICIRAILNPKLAPSTKIEGNWRDRIRNILSIGPLLLLILVVLGPIYLGIATPTESAALGVLGSLILGLVYRRLTLKVLWQSLTGALNTTCMVMFVLVGAGLISLVLANTGIPRKLVLWVVNLGLSPTFVLIGIFLIYLILGCFFDGLSIMVLTLPIVLPLIPVLGYDMIWFGIVIVILIELSLATPPVGLNLFALQGIAPQYSFELIVKGVMPFFLIDCMALIIVTTFPNVALWLPSLIK